MASEFSHSTSGISVFYCPTAGGSTVDPAKLEFKILELPKAEFKEIRQSKPIMADKLSTYGWAVLMWVSLTGIIYYIVRLFI